MKEFLIETPVKIPETSNKLLQVVNKVRSSSDMSQKIRIIVTNPEIIKTFK